MLYHDYVDLGTSIANVLLNTDSSVWSGRAPCHAVDTLEQRM